MEPHCAERFGEVCQLIEDFEGSVVRVLRTLAEFMHQLAETVAKIGHIESAEL